VLYAVLDEVVDEYEPVVAGLENDIDEIEDQLFGDSDDDALSRRIYELSREVIHFQRAVKPLAGILEFLQRGSVKYSVDLELQRSLRDVLDHAIRIDDRIASFRAILDNALAVHSALVSRRHTEAQPCPERRDQEDLLLGGHHLRSDPCGHRVRHELRCHARTRLATGVPLLPRPDAAVRAHSLRDLQSQEVALVSCQYVSSSPVARRPATPDYDVRPVPDGAAP